MFIKRFLCLINGFFFWEMNIYNSSYAVKLLSNASDICPGWLRRRRRKQSCRNERTKSIKLKGKKKDQSGDADDPSIQGKMYIAQKIMLMGMVEQKGEENERNCRLRRRKENHRWLCFINKKTCSVLDASLPSASTGFRLKQEKILIYADATSNQ